MALFFDVGNVYGPDQSVGTPIDLTNLKYAIGPGSAGIRPSGPFVWTTASTRNPTGKEKFGEIQFSMGAAF